VLGAELYREGVIVRMRVPAGGMLPMAIEVADDAGTAYRESEPTDWQGSEGVTGEIVLVPAVPRSATALTVRARFRDGTESETAIRL